MNETLSRSYSPTGRIAALDRFRGLSLLLMLAFGAAKMVTFGDFFVQFSTHDPTESFQIITGYGFYDCIAPLFVFASGLAFSSFNAQKRNSLEFNAILTSFDRGLKLIGLGGLLAFDFADPVGWLLMGGFVAYVVAVIVSFARPRKRIKIDFLTGVVLKWLGVALIIGNYLEVALLIGGVDVWNSHWSAIASIGVGLLMTISLVRLPDLGKLLTTIALTILYALACQYADHTIFDGFVHGGIAGAVGYALLFTYAYVISCIKNNTPLKLLYALLIGALGIYAYQFTNASKEGVNLTYVAISFMICYVVYLLIALFDKLKPMRFAPLTILGRNSLTVYCLHFLMTFTYGICLNALVAYVPLGKIVQYVMFFIGMIAYPLLMALLVRSLSRKKYLIRL